MLFISHHLSARSLSPATERPCSSRGMGFNALATAVVLATALSASSVHALSLGRLNVQSSLGEPLVAEIDVPEINEAEASSLRVRLAPADIYRAAGVDFNAALANTEIRLQRRPDGRAFLRVVNSRAMNEPYLDLILEASWASGRIVRDYTMLFDPPNLRAPTAAPLPPTVPAAVTTSPVPNPTLTAPPPAARPAPSPTATVQEPLARNTVAPAAPSPAPAAPRAAESAPRPVTPLPANKAETVKVKTGETAGKIAATHKPSSVTLEQMLVAMLRANPDAFINGNVNRVKAGAIIELPDTAAASATPVAEARQTIAAQSRDFNAFRQRLAANVPAVAAETPARKTAGNIQTEVTDRSAAAQTPDQLKLSKGSVAAGKETSAAEEKIAKTRQAQDTAVRTAELSRNISDLAKLETAAKAPVVAPVPAPPPPAATAAPTAQTPPIVSAPAPVETSAPPAQEKPAPAETPPVPTPATESPPPAVPATPAPEPAPAAPPPPAPPPPAAEAPPPVDEPSFLDSLMENPLVVPAAGGLVALLLGFGAYRMRQRKKNASVDSSYLESRLQPDSFFGASGGQNVDTAEAAVTGSSMMYSPSQLDAGGDVDPVAEADVYLAYGRDLQAEEILKEAMRVTPTRVAIHSKMLEIYAKRRDAKSFEVLACEVYALTQGNGPEWAHACALGQELDPGNPLYQPGGSPAVLASAVTVAHDGTIGLPNTQPFAEPDEPEISNAAAGPLDLDLDFSIDTPEPPVAVPDSALPVAQPDDNSLAFDIDDMPTPEPAHSPPPPLPAPSFDLDATDLSFDLPAAVESVPQPAKEEMATDFDLSFELPEETPPVAQSEPTMRIDTGSAPEDNNLLSFDMDDISLDLGPSTPESAEELEAIPEGDPLETKLSLAAEFLAIGDQEGARSLAEEVVEQATGALKAKASTFLSNLG